VHAQFSGLKKPQFLQYSKFINFAPFF